MGWVAAADLAAIRLPSRTRSRGRAYASARVDYLVLKPREREYSASYADNFAVNRRMSWTVAARRWRPRRRRPRPPAQRRNLASSEMLQVKPGAASAAPGKVPSRCRFAPQTPGKQRRPPSGVIATTSSSRCHGRRRDRADAAARPCRLRHPIAIGLAVGVVVSSICERPRPWKKITAWLALRTRMA